MNLDLSGVINWVKGIVTDIDNHLGAGTALGSYGLVVGNKIDLIVGAAYTALIHFSKKLGS
jgi:hypothetical protein